MKKQQLPFRYLQGLQDSVRRSAHRGHDLPKVCGKYTPIPVVPAGEPAKNPFNPDAGKAGFADVSGNVWYASAVNYVVDKGLMNGTGEDKFSPNADTTRGMIVTVLARLDGKSTAGTPWFAAGQRWAMEYEISDGTNMTGAITREQLVDDALPLCGQERPRSGYAL